ncbi:hypothetical protein BTW08_07085 [Salinicola sp. MH3R3-1]|nr:hypothetical protein BTW08_07085 [Salinicola sp. MH3R3-1]
MRMTSRDRAEPLIRKGTGPNKESLAYLAQLHDMPLGTLKTRVKRFIDQGIDRDKAIRLALECPIGPQGRPRQG